MSALPERDARAWIDSTAHSEQAGHRPALPMSPRRDARGLRGAGVAPHTVVAEVEAKRTALLGIGS